MRILLSFIILLTFFLSLSANDEYDQKRLKINLISRKSFNGRGKELDFLILKNELEGMGHQIRMYDIEDHADIENADINIFIAHCKSNYFPKAKLNWFIPNAEVCTATTALIAKFDLVLCKTLESLRIFKPIAKKVIYIGFTSIDHFDNSYQKNYLKCLHIVGGSGMKGYTQVVRAWDFLKNMPELTIIKHTNYRKYTLPKQVVFIDHWIPLQEMIALQNECGIHLCPSKTEGFGHSIMEGMAVGSVVITTDAPPMNEFIKDARCLVKYHMKKKHRLATIYEVDYKDLAQKVLKIMKLSVEELNKIGHHNRKEYIKRDADFKRRFKNLMNKTLGELNQ